jgi:hypothetical protein
MKDHYSPGVVPHSVGPYDKSDEVEQWIRISDGCPNNCPFCYEDTAEKVYPVPPIIRNSVKIMDMNLLSKPGVLDIIKDLGSRLVNGRVVNYELVCGIDYRRLTVELAEALKAARFGRMRIAWDHHFVDQMKIKDAIDRLIKAGYRNKELMVFMICNWRVPFTDNIKKLDLCKVWRVKVADCYFDGQVSPNIDSIFWTVGQIKAFRARCRKHNQMVMFGIDPEVS